MVLSVDSLLESLESLYWDSAQREICMLLLFYHEFEKAASDDSQPQSIKPNWDAFRDLFETWTRGQGTYNNEELFDSTIGKAEEHYKITNRQRLARCLLQSSSLLDLDVLYEPADQSFFSGLTKSICVEEVSQGSPVNDPVLKPLICNGCSRFLRSSIYYQCQSGCTQQDGLTDRLQKSVSQLSRSTVEDCFQPPPVRICQSCITSIGDMDGCRIQHLRKVFHKNPSLKPDIILQFQGHWNAIEKENSTAAYTRKKGSKLAGSFARKIVMLKKSYGQSYQFTPLRHTIDRIAPAGYFHLSLQFGPLILESGLEGINHGVLVQSRPFPKLFEEENMPINLVENTNEGPIYRRQCLAVFDDAKNNGQRTLSTQNREVRVRNTLALSKRVHGGAFSGYLHPEGREEAEILDSFVLEAGRNKYRRGYTVEARRKRLYKSADNLVNLIRRCLCHEVRKYLRRMAVLMMDSASKLSFNKFGNNCQKLTERLLSGKDFEYVFPRLSATNEAVDWPRYLISFGNRVSAEYIDIKQSESPLANFCLGSSKPAGDIVDALYEEELRLRDVVKDKSASFKDAATWMEALLFTWELSTPFDVTRQSSMWSHPRDALSILHHHLARASYKYLNITEARYSRDEWTKSRLNVLIHLDIFSTFTGALGNTLLEMFRTDPLKMQTLTIPKARIFGTLRAKEKVRILRFGEVATYLVHRSWSQSSLNALFESNLNPEVVTVLEKLSQTLEKAFNGGLEPLRKILMASQIFEVLLGFLSVFSEGSIRGPNKPHATIDQFLKALTFEDDWLYLELSPRTIWAMQLLKKTKNTRTRVRYRGET